MRFLGGGYNRWPFAARGLEHHDQFRANNGAIDLDLDQLRGSRRPVGNCSDNGMRLRRPLNFAKNSAPFSLAARWPCKNVLEKDAVVAGRKQSVALQASNLAIVPMTRRMDCDNLVLCAAARTTEQDRLGVIHEIKTRQVPARTTTRTKAGLGRRFTRPRPRRRQSREEQFQA
jgi:hypothetical protein